jgi:hypothetical protein
MGNRFNVDLTGRKFNKLTAVEGLNEYSTNNGCMGYQKWLCVCGCGGRHYKEPKLIGKKFGKLIYNGIDRMNSTLGYTPVNTVPCCKVCNFTKGARSYEEFAIWISNITNNLYNIEKFNKVLVYPC